MESNFDKREKDTIAFWNKFKIFERSVQSRKQNNRFVFYEGPPTANARPGIHHAETRVFKDLVCRYKTMRGFRVERRAGWDTHGLPVELEIEKKLGFKEKKDIERYGIAAFNKKCRESVWEYKKEWESLTERIGFWLDTADAYVTYDPAYMESVWFILKNAWDKKLLFWDYKVVPYCPRCGTPLSSHEVAQGYKKVKELSIYVRFPIVNPEYKGCSLLVWTTTPWTLPANVAVAANEKITYAKVRLKKKEDAPREDGCLIVAKDRLAALGIEYEMIAEIPGKDLVGLRYLPAYPHNDAGGASYRVIPADFVTLSDGTGLVHIAPAFGEDDMNVIKGQNKILKQKGMPEFPVVMTVNEDGKFNLDEKVVAGMFVKDADPLIVEDLKNRSLLFKEEIYEHDYPFCWRCKTPLLYYAKKSWFIEMTKLKRELVANNKKINWVPAHLKEGRFGEWLREVKDWAVSRERYWATPLPVWRCAKCGESVAVGSVAELLSKKFTTSRFFILRHGESERQIKKIASCWPEPEPLALTAAGQRFVAASAAKLKKERIDLIVSSDILRAKETVQLVAQATGAKVVYDKRLREFNVGAFNGKDPALVWKRLNAGARPFDEVLPKGESVRAMKKRMYEFLLDAGKKYAGQNIVVVSHEFPLTVLEWTLKGLTLEAIVAQRYSKKIKQIKPGEYRPLELKILPMGEDMELDLHRPYIDAVTFLCGKCGGVAARVPDVCDCWLDSGAMPFAQVHWPLRQGGASLAKGGPFASLGASSLIPFGVPPKGKLKPPALFPADFISEGIDQTRGWFYTLLAVSTVLGFGPPYKNVLSVGHVLDEKGEKMSKSKGNTVSPWTMVEKYGADAVRWYFFTVNSPGDPKLFNEKDIDLAKKKFLLTLWNCHVFLQTYAKGAKTAPVTSLPANVLDRWIVSRLNQTIDEAGKRMDSYDIVAAARAIEDFTVNDLSLWYVRRSRRRLQQPKNAAERRAAEKTYAHVMRALARLLAPFVPFLSEEIHQQRGGNNYKKPLSVHLEAWPASSKRLIDATLVSDMAIVRALVTQALADRAKHGIKVRQPLASITVGGKSHLSKDLRDLLMEEINVKEVIVGQHAEEGITLDYNITPALKEEGAVREILRNVKEARKEAGLTPKDRIALFFSGSKELEAAVNKRAAAVAAEAGAKKIGFRKAASVKAEKNIKTDLGGLWLGIK